MKRQFTFYLIVFFSFSLSSQNVKIGNDNIVGHPSSVLELDGTLGGLTIPQLTATQISTLRTNILSLTVAEIAEALGMMVFQTDNKSGIYFFDGNQFIKYSPHGLMGKVGGTYSEAFPSFYTFEPVIVADNLGYTTSQIGIGNYQVSFDANNYFQNYPIITISPENQKLALSSDLPIPDVTCTPSFFANCSSDFNSDQVEAVRVESFVDIDGAGPGLVEMQILQNGEGFLPPTGANVNDIWPYPNNASGGTWMGTAPTAGIGLHPGVPASGDYVLQLSGGPWGPTTDCVLQVADPCIIQDGGGNYGKYWPDVNIAANTYCNNIYHPAGQTPNQTGQLTIRLGKGAGDYFKVYLESSRQWADDLATWIDWNRDGDFTDPGEALGSIPEPTCFGQGSGTISLCSGPTQVPVDAGAQGTGTAGEFIVPSSAELGLTTLRVMSVWAATNLLSLPCNVTTWGETEDYVVEIYDADVGSVVGVGNDFEYNAVVCAIEEITQSGLEYSGFKVSCKNILGIPVDTKIHWDATENTFY